MKNAWENIRKIIIILLLPCLLFAGCNTNKIVNVYYPDGENIKSIPITVESVTPEEAIKQLKEFNVIQGAIRVNRFENKDGEIQLDLSQDFCDYLTFSDAKKQVYSVQCLANTFIKTFEAENIIITCNGKPLLTNYYNFSGKITFAESVAVQTPELTPEPTAEPTPTPTLVPTATPTSTATKKPATATPKPTPFYTPDRDDKTKKYVAITFDDGPHAVYTRKIVDKAKEYSTGVTFFVVGNRVNEALGAEIKYAVDNGCEVEVHGYTHTKYYNKCTDAEFDYELSKTAEVIEKYTGKKPTMMRPIGGAINSTRVARSPYSVILWNVDSNDWKYKKAGQENVDTIVNNVMSTVSDGSIILMHEIYENSYQAFCIIMERLYAQGYEVVTVSELIGANNVKPATKYYSAK